MNNWKLALLIPLAFVFVGGACVFGVQSSQNKAIALEQAVEMAESDIHVQEKRRIDLLPNLVDAVKQYDKHEAEVLQAIVDGRGGAAGIENVSMAISADRAFNNRKSDCAVSVQLQQAGRSVPEICKRFSGQSFFKLGRI